jgi:hypothetical protein
MKKILLSFGLGAALAFSAAAEDVDYTDRIINNSFEYAWEGQIAGAEGCNTSGMGWKNNNSWRPWFNSTSTNTHNEFYGWDVTDWSMRLEGNDAQSLEKGGANIEGTFDICIFGNGAFPEFWELSQVINGLPAGIYKVEARLAVNRAKRTTQRLFANSNVQYYGTEANYSAQQLTVDEVNTFAGNTSGSITYLEEMVVYTTIAGGNALKIGIRTGGKMFNGTVAGVTNEPYGCFRADYFRLTKLDPANPAITDATLSALLVNSIHGDVALTPAFDPETTTYACILPKGTQTVTPAAIANITGATISGAEAVDVSGGTGTSTIVVTAIDGATPKTYTINYSIAADGPTDLTHLIINNDFDYASDGALLDADGDQIVDDSFAGVGKDANGYRVVRAEPKVFYGWTTSMGSSVVDIAGAFTGESQGINAAPTNKHGDFAMWVGSGAKTGWGNDWKISQTIDKTKLGAGTYKVQCRMALDDGHTINQRLFANKNVQYFRSEANYSNILTEGETNTFAGYTISHQEALQEMKVYITITGNDDLELGIRMGETRNNGSEISSGSPLFKSDYFRLVKLDPADAANADLANITLSAGTIAFDPATISYNITLPEGTEKVTPTAIAVMEDVKITGTEEVEVAATGGGISEITVTALDGTTTKKYTINYVVSTGIAGADVASKIAQSVSYSTLTGIAAPATAKGLLLKKVTYTDGSVKITKVMNK